MPSFRGVLSATRLALRNGVVLRVRCTAYFQRMALSVIQWTTLWIVVCCSMYRDTTYNDGSEMAITRDKIWAAADDIDSAGQNPTLAAVRKAVGGGSFTTIQEAMVEWKARRAAKEAPLREPPPQGVTDRFAELGADVWAVAVDLAHTRLTAERAALEANRAEMGAARQEAAELADQLAAELEETKIKGAALETAERTARAEADDLRQRLAAAEARGIEIERQAGGLQQEVEKVRQSAAEARERLAELGGKVTALEAQNAALLDRLGPAEVPRT